MDDDLNSPQALAAIFDLCRKMNQSRDRGTNVSKAADLVHELTGVLGFTLEAPPQKEDGLSDDAINDLIEQRKIARNEKRWGDADAVRDQLDAVGISIADSGGETTWTRD
jgi:cysteinyl-tRNA synthetase